MAKSDLLKEAIADAKAVKETALANAKIALEEAFAPRIQSMLSTKLAEDLYDEDEDLSAELDVAPEGEPVATEFDAASELDVAPIEEPVATDVGVEEDLELEAIIRELEEDLNEDSLYEQEEEAEVVAAVDQEPAEEDLTTENFNIDEIIESILEEDDIDEELASSDIGASDNKNPSADSSSNAIYEEDLKEAYTTIKSLQGTINEVNLLNAKLLYTNKLFRNFELSENQKMTIIENFDRAATTREVKLVFSTLAESFNVPVKKRKMVKENFASTTTGTTAPSTKTKRIINEGNELANRWKKLAGLLD